MFLLFLLLVAWGAKPTHPLLVGKPKVEENISPLFGGDSRLKLMISGESVILVSESLETFTPTAIIVAHKNLFSLVLR